MSTPSRPWAGSTSSCAPRSPICSTASCATRASPSPVWPPPYSPGSSTSRTPASTRSRPVPASSAPAPHPPSPSSSGWSRSAAGPSCRSTASPRPPLSSPSPNPSPTSPPRATPSIGSRRAPATPLSVSICVSSARAAATFPATTPPSVRSRPAATWCSRATGTSPRRPPRSSATATSIPVTSPP